MRRKNAKIRIGPDFQADIPDLLILPVQTTHEPSNAKGRVWAPSESLSEIKLDEFILLSKEKFGYDREQAMGMLYWHHYDLEKAIRDLPNFTPLPDDWTHEDMVKFESALSKHGKDFLRIKQMMPDKPTATLIKHYYLEKHKIEKRNTVIDKRFLEGSSSAKLDDKKTKKPNALVTKYFCLWKHKSRKRQKCNVND